MRRDFVISRERITATGEGGGGDFEDFQERTILAFPIVHSLEIFVVQRERVFYRDDARVAEYSLHEIL